MELRRIRHALVLASEGSFVRAAAKLHITQSALSQSIAKLEKEIGSKLFDRTHGTVSLTSLGKEFVARSEDLLLSERTLMHKLRQIVGCEIGRISFGLSPVVSAYLLGTTLVDLVNNHPKLQVHVELANVEDLLDYVTTERIEFVVLDTWRNEFDQNNKFSVRELTKMPVGFYVRSVHPLASIRGISLQQMREFPILCAPITKSLEYRVRRWLGLSAADALPRSVECADYSALKHVMLNSDSVFLAPYTCIAAELAAGQLVELMPIDQQFPGRVAIRLAMLANRTPSPAAQMIIERIETFLTVQASLAQSSSNAIQTNGR